MYGIVHRQSNAFDLVKHTFLWLKKERYVIRGTPLELSLSKSYFRNRTYYVTVNGTKSNILGKTLDVPQGSVLGPMLYIIHVNDFYYGNAILFADEKTLLKSDTEAKVMVSKANKILS